MSRVILCIKKFSICPQQFKLSIACLSLRSQIWKRIFKLFLDVETDHVETKILNRITIYRKVEEDHPEITTEMEHKKLQWQEDAKKNNLVSTENLYIL